MEQIALPIVITGHIDHGKSTLIGRLLYDTGVLKEDRYREVIQTSSMLGKETEFAFVLDALEEERERGITIDTTQIYFQTPKRKYVIIDAPGHKEFLRNMITGASYAEAAVLIVDAKEGVKEQTKRHAYLLGLVGIRQLCVLINKMDLVDFSEKVFEDVKSEISRFFENVSIQPKAFVPLSALSGINVAHRGTTMGWYQGPTLLEALDALDYKTFEQRPFRFPVQDVYRMENQDILVGRIESGEVQKGMDIFILPKGTKDKIKELKKFMISDPEKASYGESIGLVVEGNGPIQRGEVLSADREPMITQEFGARLFWFQDTYEEGEKVKFRCTTQESDCRMTLHHTFDPATMDQPVQTSDRLQIGEVATVTIRTEKEVVIDLFSYIPEMGRFIIEKEGVPVGGGIIG